MAFHSEVTGLGGQGTPCQSVRRERTGHDDLVELHRRRQHRAEVMSELRVLGRRPERDERARPPLNVVVAGKHIHRRRARQLVDEQARRLELPVPGPQGEIAGDDDHSGFEIGDERLDRVHLRQVARLPEVEVREVDDGKAHASLSLVSVCTRS